MKKLLTIPNILTCLRIVGTLLLLWLTPFSTAFFIVYALCGVSDVLDGFIARVTGTASPFGAKLDSAADLLFYTVMMLRILPALAELLPRQIWLWVGGILLLRVCGYLTAALRFRRFASMHTYLNKLTGASLFLVPFFVGHGALTGYSIFACSVATLSTVEELVIHLTASAYQPERKTLLARQARTH